MIDVSKYQELFLSEAKEHLNTLNQSLLLLEKEPSNLAPLEAIFRAAHTIKGMAGSMGYSVISDLAHEMENLLEILRAKQMKLTPKMVDLLFASFDGLETIIEKGETQETIKQAQNLITQLRQFTKTKKERKKREKILKEIVTEEEIKFAKEKGLFLYQIDLTLEKKIPLKEARVLVILHDLAEIGEIIKTSPEKEKIQTGKFEWEFSIVLATKEEEQKIRERLNYPEITTLTVKKIVEETPLREVFTPEAILEKRKSVRISTERLDALMDLTSELIIARERLKDLVSKGKSAELVENVEFFSGLLSDLQHEVLMARLVPIGEIFDRFPRMIRDAAKQMEKEVEFIVEGREIELDRSVIQVLGDPLLHLLRNAIDHGIETLAERKKLGKNPKGTIRLVAERLKESVTIIVEDDGWGMNTQRILKVAVEKDIIKEEEAPRLTEKEIFNLTTIPGVSTSERVTEVSGRGVGLDVVKSRIHSLGGGLEIFSQKNFGSKFVLKVPLTVAIIRVLLVSCAGRKLALPLSQIVEILQLKQSDLKMLEGKEILLWRKKILPLLRLEKYLIFERSPYFSQKSELKGIEKNDSIPTVVIESGKEELALAVGRIWEQQEIVVKSLDPLLAKEGFFAGVTILGSGEPCLILDVSALGG
ncbi:MAG: chemotaxis protein CheA [Candidatus Edwardsbacteria bacterium]